MSQAYIYTIRPSRQDFVETMGEREQAVMDEHFAHLKSMLKAGTLVIAGPCEDAAFGIVVFYAESDRAAQAIMDNDPAVRGGLMRSELHRFRISLLAGSAARE